VDLASGTCYIARELLQQLPDGARLAREVAMHETVVGDDQMTQMALIDAVMTAFFKEGRVVDAPPAVASPSLSPGPKGERTTGSGLLIP
jgi:hypothetical protein